jgi:hypothetical protein
MKIVTGYRYRDNDKLELFIRACPSCGLPHRLTVDLYAFENWSDGIHSVQEAFPDKTPAERELLLTGICGTCFSKMPGEDDEP